MRAAVIQFPGSNCDRDLAVAFEKVTGKKVTLIWHKEAIIPKNIDIKSYYQVVFLMVIT